MGYTTYLSGWSPDIFYQQYVVFKQSFEQLKSSYP